MTSTVPLACTQEGCKAALDGKCVDGVSDYTKCPKFGANVQVQGQVQMADVRVGPKNTIMAYSGDALTPADAYPITAAQKFRLIVLGGDVGCGKTTLTAGIYERLLKKPTATISFAGSRTLRAFEERCHLSREASGLKTPDMDRTKRTDVPHLLHLAVRRPGGPIEHLLITDTTGENFDEALHTTADAKRLEILRRADVFALLIGGAKLASPQTRHKIAERARMLARRLVEAQMLRPDQTIEIIVTKGDVIQQASDAKLNAYKETLLTSIKDAWIEQYPHIRTRTLAARPHLEAEAFESLLKDWLEDAPKSTTKLAAAVPVRREMDRLTALLHQGPGP